MATDIINDLEVMCIDDDCPWRVIYFLFKGPLSDMKRHYDEECVMKVIEKEK